LTYRNTPLPTCVILPNLVVLGQTLLKGDPPKKLPLVSRPSRSIKVIETVGIAIPIPFSIPGFRIGENLIPGGPPGLQGLEIPVLNPGITKTGMDGRQQSLYKRGLC